MTVGTPLRGWGGLGLGSSTSFSARGARPRRRPSCPRAVLDLAAVGPSYPACPRYWCSQSAKSSYPAKGAPLRMGQPRLEHRDLVARADDLSFPCVGLL